MGLRLPSLPVQILIAAVLGVAGGVALDLVPPDQRPEWVLKTAELIAQAFIRLIKMVVAPLLLCVVTVAIAGVEDKKKLGRVGGKAFLYFYALTTVALLLGLVAVNLLRPGEGFPLSPEAAAGAGSGSGDAAAVAKYREKAHAQDGYAFVLNIIPESVVDALAKGNLLQVLFFAVLLGLAVSSMGHAGRPVTEALKTVGEAMLKIIALVVKLSPPAVAAALLFAVGKHGTGSLARLGMFVAVVYATMAVFVVCVLGLVCRWAGFSLFRLLAHIREEIVLVLGMSSSEAALPRLMEKMETFGCPRPVVGLVVPTGYSFNLDGTCIYLSIAAVFLAQAYGITLDWQQQLYLVLVLMITSKGAAAVTGGGFITLAATLETTKLVPVEGLTLLIGVDRFLSEARATVNLIGNAVACVVISRSEGESGVGSRE
jgi:aerobic C4-dicarboxylate transport protein